MSGIVLEDTEVIEAMELGTAGRYIPVSLKKDGSYTATSSLITEEQLRLLRRQIAGQCGADGRTAAPGKDRGSACQPQWPPAL